MAGKKSSLVAVVLSLIVAGSGHLYLGNYKKGLLFFLLGEVLSAAVYVYVDPTAGEIIGLFGSVYAAYDAYRIVHGSCGAMKNTAENMPDIRI